MDQSQRQLLTDLAAQWDTPSYVYFLGGILQRIANLKSAFEGRFEISYAVKANPNVALLEYLRPHVATLDISSIGEAERSLSAGFNASDLTFSGPAKRVVELERSVELGIGEMVCESRWELEQLQQIAKRTGQTVPCFIRINPARGPRHFRVNMAGRATQFGIDEEELDSTLEQFGEWDQLELCGFHIYSGTNCLDEQAIADNMGVFIELFIRFSEKYELNLKKLIFGAGFGIPYTPDDQPLDLARLAELINPQLDEMKRVDRLANVACALEIGRYIVGPEGYFLTSVINEKRSRGTEIRMCDAGFNGHLAACGMMGAVIRRNWPIWKVNSDGSEPTEQYMLTGPLCTTIDLLATKIDLPELHRGDVLAVGSSGAYGLTASPTGFISQPVPKEYLVIEDDEGTQIVNITKTDTAIAT